MKHLMIAFMAALLPVLPVSAEVSVSADSFGCIRDLTPVRGFFVGNLKGDLEATLKVAHSDNGGRYPPGSVVQLVPTEAMVKHEQGFNPATNDWEFLDIAVSADKNEILARGFTEVNNRFGRNCFACHVQADKQWDLICENDHGCAPLALTETMIRGIQKTDPRCEPQALSDEEQAALQQLQSLLEKN